MITSTLASFGRVYVSPVIMHGVDLLTSIRRTFQEPAYNPPSTGGTPPLLN